jgi:hypothetical protein
MRKAIVIIACFLVGLSLALAASQPRETVVEVYKSPT